MIAKIKKIKYKKLLFTSLVFLMIFIAVSIMEMIIEPMGYYHPDYEKTDIIPILEKAELSEEDYKELFYQTGLGKTALDEYLKDEDNGKNKILQFQENFFRNNNILCESIGIITSQESLVNEENKPIYGFDLADYKNGYVLITKATHSLGWRHGHAAIITDAENMETLEAVILGSNTMLQNINKWRVYPSFMMLKLKDASQDELDEISKFAKESLNDIPYGLTVGLTSKKNPNPEDISSTQCSHLVWYPFMQHGFNIDYDGSWLVTPKDIANSDLFEVVQIYGVNPEDIWP
ncbi:hypothetical protein HZF24_09010 [Sedimentibacter hydroxybenzoicus DSM 7310]|uniref:Permuted papain-like amidase enzyme, YaeF/YiiX, C92 family n=1 Tax=Sedimentibacter hydroxybenzoicus DSM 7310 TaxID=1123245 RepID=A0A974BJF1_SEDHY|nr:hypothetical protein [Sedimentibacter hydroxybenzoicus]NYB74283.1 hypothetical protein [Sedimentibacter hydroxybenzoicus DSM 7310]